MIKRIGDLNGNKEEEKRGQEKVLFFVVLPLFSKKSLADHSVKRERGRRQVL
jgi:hypothetical protein